MSERTWLTLSQLTGMIRAAVEDWARRACPVMVVAEVSEIRRGPTGHWFLRLVERRDEGVVAELQAIVWSRQTPILEAFRREAGVAVAAGMEILMSGSVSYHERYGMRFDITAIDATYTLGEMQRRRREVIERLTREGLMATNKGLPLTEVIQRIAIVSSSNAAGYGDFVRQLETNPYGYAFTHRLFSAAMQGDAAEASVVSALDRIAASARLFDVVVVIRGGGSQVDLSCFDSYGIAAAIARCPLPVMTGLGHERDESVADLVANTRAKTPTAAAQAIVTRARAYEERIEDMWSVLVGASGAVLTAAAAANDLVAQRFARAAVAFVGRTQSRLDGLVMSLGGLVPGILRALEQRIGLGVRALWRNGLTGLTRAKSGLRDRVTRLSLGSVSHFRGEELRLEGLGRAIQHLDPLRILQRGFSVTRFQGKALTDDDELLVGDELETRLANGRIYSRVIGLGGKGEER